LKHSWRKACQHVGLGAMVEEKRQMNWFGMVSSLMTSAGLIGTTSWMKPI
jgi:hypothetical protein